MKNLQKSLVVRFLLFVCLSMFLSAEVPDRVTKIADSIESRRTVIWNVTTEYEHLGKIYSIYFFRSSITVPKAMSLNVFVLTDKLKGKEIAMSKAGYSQISQLFPAVIEKPILLGDFCKLIAKTTIDNDSRIIDQDLAMKIGGTKILQEENIGSPTIIKDAILFYELNLAGQIWKTLIKSENGKLEVSRVLIDCLPESKQ